MKAGDQDTRVPTREDAVLRYLLDKQAAQRPDKIFLKVPGEPGIVYADFLRQVQAVAAGLARLGVKQGDMVATWLPNGVDAVRLWFAINWLGAVNAPFNTAYKGRLLEHVINDCGAALLIAHGDLLDRIPELDLPKLKTVVVSGGAAPAGLDRWTVLARADLDGDPADIPALERPIEPWDDQCIIYTSGTTGPSKGVVTSYAHLAATGGVGLPMVDDKDILLAAGPLFHGSGVMPVYAMLLRGSTSVLLPMFTTGSFWQEIRETGVTVAILLGVMTAFLAKEPPSAKDLDHSLRKVIFVPLPDDWRAFSERFGVTAYTCFNMSETSIPIVSEPNPRAPGTCGKLRAGMEARVVDKFDRELPPGTVGELILRADAPWSMNSGYLGNPAGTARAWRNGWFHTGDAFRCDEEGNFFFVDRLKDAIRRRGENISSYEVETEILTHPRIRECAVIGVPSENSEDEVMAVVAAREGMELDPREIHEFLVERLAHFMVPRYIRIMAELPRTPSQKVKKESLREDGVTADSWDREREGIKVRRTVIKA